MTSSPSVGRESSARDDAEGAALIEANVERVVRLITNCAQHMAAKLNASVYLVGSILHNPWPRDCDVRVIVADHEFGQRFGHTLKPTERRGWTHCIAWDEDGPSQR